MLISQRHGPKAKSGNQAIWFRSAGQNIPTGAVQFFSQHAASAFYFLFLEKRPGYPGIYNLLAAPAQVLGLQQCATKTGFFVLKEVRPPHKLWGLLKWLELQIVVSLSLPLF